MTLILMTCRGEHHVMPIITAIRHLDQVLIVMPFFEHHDFRVSSTVPQI